MECTWAGAVVNNRSSPVEEAWKAKQFLWSSTSLVSSNLHLTIPGSILHQECLQISAMTAQSLQFLCIFVFSLPQSSVNRIKDPGFLEGGPKRGRFLLTTLLPAACSARTWVSVSGWAVVQREGLFWSPPCPLIPPISWCSLRSWHPRIFLSEETRNWPGPHRVSHRKQREACGGSHRRRRFGRRPGGGAGLSLPRCTREGNTTRGPEGLLKASGTTDGRHEQRDTVPFLGPSAQRRGIL